MAAGCTSNKTTSAPSGKDSAELVFVAKLTAGRAVTANTRGAVFSFVSGTETNSLRTAPFVALNNRIIPSEPAAATLLPSGAHATEYNTDFGTATLAISRMPCFL